MSSTTSSACSTPTSSASSSPATSPNVSCESVPATPTQQYTPPRPASPPTRPMPQFEQLPVAYHARPAKWVLCYMPNAEWAVSFVIQHESDNHLWLVPFFVNTQLVAKHPWSGEPCQTWIVQETVIDPVYGISSFTSVRMHRKNIVDFHRVPTDLAVVGELQDLTRVKFRLPYYAPHYPAFFAAQVCQRIANDRVARGEGTPMNIAPMPAAPRKRSAPYGIPLRNRPGDTPVSNKKPRKEPLPLVLPVSDSPVSKSMETDQN